MSIDIRTVIGERCAIRGAFAHTLAALLLGACATSSPVSSASSDSQSSSWTLTWSDEFTGPAGTSLDGAKWVFDTGGTGWGNREREYYTTRAENVSLDGDGHLVITARATPGSAERCWYGACAYTSARIKTIGKFAQAYGRFEARIRLPRGQGIWPAFWMLGQNIDTVGWPRSGEIDIMEHIGREPRSIHGTVHGPGYSGAQGIGGADMLGGGAYADDFHVFAVEWRPSDIRWFVDGRMYRHTTPADLPTGAAWVFDHPFFMLLNLAVGGDWPGDPDSTSTYPQQMVLDYVRVYR